MPGGGRDDGLSTAFGGGEWEDCLNIPHGFVFVFGGYYGSGRTRVENVHGTLLSGKQKMSFFVSHYSL